MKESHLQEKESAEAKEISQHLHMIFFSSTQTPMIV